MTAWQDKAPADMTFEELQEARQAVQERYNKVLEDMNWVGAALNHLSSEVATRFNMPIPGFPATSSLPEYPQDQVISNFKS